MLLTRSATMVWLLVELQVKVSSAFIQFPNRVEGLHNDITHSRHCALSCPLYLPRSVRDIFAAGSSRGSRGTILKLRMSEGDSAVRVSTPGPRATYPVFDALIYQFTSPQNGNVTATVEEYLDLCDHALLTYLRAKIISAGEQSETVRLYCPGPGVRMHRSCIAHMLSESHTCSATNRSLAHRLY